jgi:hypothetical protein
MEIAAGFPMATASALRLLEQQSQSSPPPRASLPSSTKRVTGGALADHAVEAHHNLFQRVRLGIQAIWRPILRSGSGRAQGEQDTGGHNETLADSHPGVHKRKASFWCNRRSKYKP